MENLIKSKECVYGNFKKIGLGINYFIIALGALNVLLCVMNWEIYPATTKVVQLNNAFLLFNCDIVLYLNKKKWIDAELTVDKEKLDLTNKNGRKHTFIYINEITKTKTKKNSLVVFTVNKKYRIEYLFNAEDIENFILDCKKSI